MNCPICNTILTEGSSVCPKCQTTKLGQIGSHTFPFWKQSKLFLGLICVLGLWMISAIAGIFSPKTVEIELVDISPNNEVDEERFLLFLLEHELDSILFFSHEAPERAAPAIEETKEYAQSIVAHLQHHPVENKGIMESFQRVVGLADAYKSMLGDLGVMEVAAKGESGKMVLETGAKSAVLGYGAAQMLDTGDGSTFVFGALTGVVGAWYEGQTIEANRKAQIERVTAGFYTQVDQARADAVAVADDVAANLNEARDVLTEIKEHVASNPDYHYLLVRLFSINGEQKEALEHLKTALAKGFDKISEAKKSQDLEKLRKAHGDEVDALLAVNFGWSVTYPNCQQPINDLQPNCQPQNL